MWYLLPLAGFIDRVRGGFPEGKRPSWVKYLLITFIGPIMVSQVTTDLTVLLISLLIGHIMWRQSNSWRGSFVLWKSKTKDWDSEYLQASLGWGAWAGTPFLLLSIMEPGLAWFFPAFIFGAPAAMFLSLVIPPLPKVMEMRNAWPISEFIELILIGALAHIFELLLS